MKRNVVRAVGSDVPARVLTNAELTAWLDTSDAWIRERTGIARRHVAAAGEETSHLGTRAAAQALERAGMEAASIELVILATATPDDTFPGSAVRIQAALGAHNAAAFDVNAACSGFVYAMHIADAMLKAGPYRRALVIGAECMSRVVDWQDRRTAILFGDGAGACVLEAVNGGERGILHSQIASDGRFRDMLYTDGGVATTQTAGHLHMEGKEVFRHAVEKMTQTVLESARAAAIDPQDITHLVPHQANARILSACAKRMRMDEDRVVKTVEQHANTSSASIPLALAYLAENAKLQINDIVMLTALGAGFTWGSCLLRW